MRAEFDHKTFLKRVSTRPGVYLMQDAAGKVIYVGKAKNLRQRLRSYFLSQVDSVKTQRLVAHIAHIDTLVTATENEALLLENSLIKQHHPKFNVMWRDDKSYPQLYLSSHEDYPGLYYLRTKKRRKKGEYFGPYTDARAVRAILDQMQRLFKLRSCSNTFFRNRSRPCLQYQINRCTAPCVGLVSPEEYADQIAQVVMFLRGKNQQLIHDISAKMQQHSQAQRFEKAAQCRDTLQDLQHIQQSQHVVEAGGDYDIAVIVPYLSHVLVHMLHVSGGNLVNHFFSQQRYDAQTQEADELLSRFLTHYYLGPHYHPNMPQKKIHLLTNILPAEHAWLEQAISQKLAVPLVIQHAPKSRHAKAWLGFALDNIKIYAESLRQEPSEALFEQQRIAFQQRFKLAKAPSSIECFDISHTQGDQAVGACVVFNEHGPDKKRYRGYKVEPANPGDDYEAMRLAVIKRYGTTEHPKMPLPDVLLIDGGKGQVSAVTTALEGMLEESCLVLGIAKGVERKVGAERLIKWPEMTELHLRSDDLAFHLIHQVRDEAHRFSVQQHRKKRRKKSLQSVLETIPGIGKAKRQALLDYFGGLQGIKAASIEDIAKAPGISMVLAQRIYAALHTE